MSQANTVVISPGATAVVSDSTVNVASVWTQGLPGPSKILGKDVGQGTVTANGSLLNYDSTQDIWVATVAPTGLTIGGGNF